MQVPNEAEMQRMMMLEEMRHYNLVVSHCFNECIRSMSSKKLVPAEVTCLENCYKKTSKFNERFVQALNYVNMTRDPTQTLGPS